MTPKQEEYRKNLLHDLGELRGYDIGRDLASTFLERERKQVVFKRSETKYIKTEEEYIRNEKESFNQVFRTTFLQILEKVFGREALEIHIKVRFFI